MRVAVLALVIACGLGLSACERPASAPQPQAIQPDALHVQRLSAARYAGEPAASLVVDLSKTATGSISLDATLTNETDVDFTTSASEILLVSSGSRNLYGGGEQAYGGNPLKAHTSRSWHLRVPALSQGVLTVTAANWFVPRPERGAGAMDWAAVEVTASVAAIPRAK